jgi:hypothetical protein
MFMPDADDAVDGHYGPVAATHELILTRSKGELARQAAYTPLEEAFVCVSYASRV